MAIFVFKDEIISLKELLKRWENCSFGGSAADIEEIDRFITTKLLIAYNITKYIPENGKMTVKLTVNPSYLGTKPFHTSHGLVFLLDKIKELEKNIRGEINISDFRADSESEGKNIDDFFDSFPICHELYKLYLEGKSRAEIVIDLTSRNLATNLQAGWLTKTDKRYQSDDALKQEIKRLKKPKQAE